MGGENARVTHVLYGFEYIFEKLIFREHLAPHVSFFIQGTIGSI